MDAAVKSALAKDRTIDITTTGRRSGELRRIETWFYNVDGRVFLSGTPGRRDWYANLAAKAEFVFHLKQSVNADLPARARLVTDPAERREIVEGNFRTRAASGDVDRWVEGSPIAAVVFDP